MDNTNDKRMEQMDALISGKTPPSTAEDDATQQQMWQHTRAILVETAYHGAGVPRAFRYTSFAATTATDVYNQSAIACFQGIQRAFTQGLPRLLAQPRLGYKMRMGNKSVTMLSLLLHGGDAHINSMFAADIAKSVRLEATWCAGYYEFGELVQTLSDYAEIAEQRNLCAEMRALDLVIVDGINGGKYGAAFGQNWDILISARNSSGKPTLLLCGDGYEQLPGSNWRTIIHGDGMVKINCDCMFNSKKPLLKTAVANATTTPTARPDSQSDAATLATDAASIRARIIEMLSGKRDYIRKQVYDAFPADALESVKAEFNALLHTGQITSYKRGNMELFTRADTGDFGDQNIQAARSAPMATLPLTTPNSPSPARKTVRELAAITGYSTSTISGLRNKNYLSDEQIIARAHDRTQGANRGEQEGANTEQ